MTRDELEGAIWRVWPTRGPEAGKAVDAILAAADAYGLAQYGITADRRAALVANRTTDERALRAAPSSLVIHYAPAGRVSACGRIARITRPRPDVTPDPALVTCLACIGTRRFQGETA